MADRLPRVLAVRLDSDGDVLLTGSAIRALAAGSSRVDLLASPRGAEAARLLPGVDQVHVFDPPWDGVTPAAVEPEHLEGLLDLLRAGRYDQAVIFTSFHQSPLPMALLAKWAGIAGVAATSEDYPGSLLDVRHRRMPGGGVDDGGPAGDHEVRAALALAAAAGFPLPPGDDGRLQIVPVPRHEAVESPYVVVHPSASVPSRAIGAVAAQRISAALAADGWRVVVTGGPGEESLGEAATPPGGLNLGGHTSLAELAAVLAGASALVVGNTGPAHLAAAVGTPVVSLFAPVVPAARWAPWGVPHVVLGDQGAPCAGTRSRVCPVPGHPCLSSVQPDAVTRAVRELTGIPGVLADSLAAQGGLS